jgi:hypothetical protein
MHAWQPDIQIVKDFSVSHARRAKQFGLGNLKEPNVRAIENNARGIDVAPEHAFFDSEFLEMIH